MRELVNRIEQNKLAINLGIFGIRIGSFDVVLSVVTADGPDELQLSNYVTVHFPPVATAGPDEDICIGQSGQLQAFGGSSYQWSPATGLSNPGITNPTVTVSETTTYTVLVTDANDCQDEDEVTVVVHELPTVIASVDDNTLCPGDTAALSAIGALNYQWSPNLFVSSNTGDSVSAWPPSDFTWTVYGTDAFGCAHDTTEAIDVLAAPVVPVVTNLGMTVSSTPASGYQWLLEGDLIRDQDPRPRPQAVVRELEPQRRLHQRQLPRTHSNYRAKP